jgi:hypothetical protein
MALRTGLAAQIGFGEEVTYGTRVAPTRFLEFSEESLELDIARMEAFGIRASAGTASGTVARTDRWAAGRRNASGSVVWNGDTSAVANKGFSMIYKHIMGAAPTIATHAAGTLSKDHDFVLGDPQGMSLTTQIGTPGVGGTIRVREYEGCKVLAAEWTQELDGWLGLSLDLDGEDETTSQSLASASYPASQELFHWGQATHTIAGSGVDVTSYNLRLERSLANERYRQNAITLKKEPLLNGEVMISGSVELEWDTLTEYTRYTAGTTAALISTWTGSIIEGAIPFQLIHTLNAVRWDNPEGPNISGPDLVTFTAPFKALYDGTLQPLAVRYTTTDTAI